MKVNSFFTATRAMTYIRKSASIVSRTSRCGILYACVALLYTLFWHLPQLFFGFKVKNNREYQVYFVLGATSTGVMVVISMIAMMKYVFGDKITNLVLKHKLIRVLILSIPLGYAIYVLVAAFYRQAALIPTMALFVMMILFGHVLFKSVTKICPLDELNEYEQLQFELTRDGSSTRLFRCYLCFLLFASLSSYIFGPFFQEDTFRLRFFIRVFCFPLCSIIVGALQSLLTRHLGGALLERKLVFLHLSLDYLSITGAYLTLDPRQIYQEFWLMCFSSAIFDILARLSYPAQMKIFRKFHVDRHSKSRSMSVRSPKVQPLFVSPSQPPQLQEGRSFIQAQDRYLTEEIYLSRGRFVIQRSIHEVAMIFTSPIVLYMVGYADYRYRHVPLQALDNLMVKCVFQLVMQVISDFICTYVEHRYQGLHDLFDERDIRDSRFFTIVSFITVTWMSLVALWKS